MVRIPEHQLVENYAYLAKLYDALLQDPDGYSYWLRYITEYVKGKDILDLASGSAVLVSQLGDLGYDVIASDMSEAMKQAAKVNFDGDYRILDMRCFSIPERFDGILCICDSINYLADLDEVSATLKSAYDHLKTGGSFIFDMHHLRRLEEFEETYIEEGTVEDIDYRLSIKSDGDKLYSHFVFYTEDKVIEERHKQKIFRPDEVKRRMEEVGYKATYIPDFIPDEKVLFVGEKI